MNWINRIQNALNYIEEHIIDDLDYEVIAKETFSSSFHFQRVFHAICGYTLGEYIRNRRLTLAGLELTSNQVSVVNVALKYGYESPESFSRAFQKFHGITPKQARNNGAKIKSFSRLFIRVATEGGASMNYRIETKPSMILTGYKSHFIGNPNDKKKQDHYFICENRVKQYILQGMSKDFVNFYQVLTNFTPDGYDFYVAHQLPNYALETFNRDLGEMAKEFDHLHIPEGQYLICETARSKNPTNLISDLRRRALTELLPSIKYELREAPEINLLHWYYEEGNAKLNTSRYFELWLPIIKKDEMGNNEKQ